MSVELDKTFKPYDLNVFRCGWLTWRRPLRSLRLFFMRFKYVYQRAKYGFCDYDIYDVGDYKYEILVQSLKKYLKDNDQSYPVAFESAEEWEKVVADMIEKLEVGRSECHLNPYLEPDKTVEVVDNGKVINVDDEWVKNVQKVCAEIADVELKAREEGLAAYAKFLPNLWI